MLTYALQVAAQEILRLAGGVKMEDGSAWRGRGRRGGCSPCTSRTGPRLLESESSTPLGVDTDKDAVINDDSDGPPACCWAS